jgi:hypothetical protein
MLGAGGGGEIGLRDRFKSCCPKGRVGSNPTRRTSPRPAMTHSSVEVDRALALAADGLNASEIARATGINRSSIREWLGLSPTRVPHPPWIACPRCNPRAELDNAAYAYLLGAYLGDGTITRQAKGVWRLRIFQTARYPDLIEECATSMHAVLPNNVLRRPCVGCVEIGSSSKHWPCRFPQAGPGRKHERPILLEPWQQELVDQHPKLLLRGLVHSDGCRHLNRIRRGDKEYAYVRYEFSNASDDIRRIFTDTCDGLGVHWTQMNARNVAVSRREDVAFLDTFIGPKS